MIVLAVFVAATGLFIAHSESPLPSVSPDSRGRTDLGLYLKIVRRVHDGEGYYDAAGRELRALGYPTRSMFNWRLPLYAWMYGMMPSPVWGQAILIFLAIVALLLSCDLALREGGVPLAVANGVLLVGALGWCAGTKTTLYTELWAGTLIALSVVAYARGWWLVGVAAGMFALYYRELTLPYVFVSAGIALMRGRRSEMLIWTGGLVLFVLFLVSHGAQVASRVTSADLPQRHNWLQFGGAGFIVATARMNILIMMLPPWFTAVYLSLALLGLASWRSETACRVRMTVALYVGSFAAVGYPFNGYWGLLIAPLLTFGAARSLSALYGLLVELRPGRPLTA